MKKRVYFHFFIKINNKTFHKPIMIKDNELFNNGKSIPQGFCVFHHFQWQFFAKTQQILSNI